jgi:hypothetical protein
MLEKGLAMNQIQETAPTRRGVLKGAAALVGALVVPAPLTRPAGATGGGPGAAQLTAFIRVERTGKVLILSPTTEMGQGTRDDRRGRVGRRYR